MSAEHQIPWVWQRPEETMPPVGETVFIWDQWARVGKWNGERWSYDGIETKRDPEWWAAFDEPPS